MKTLFLFIPHYVFSSDLLHTDYIKILSENYKVVIFSPIFESENPAGYYYSPNVTYIPWLEENPKFWLFFTKILRVSLIREFDNLEYYKLRQLTKANLNWQRKILRRAGWFLPRFMLTAKFFTKLEEFLIGNSPKFQMLTKKYKPSIVVTCTPGFSFLEAEAIIMAKKNRLKTIAIDSSWDNFTSNAVQFRKTDYLACWNEIMKKEAMEIHTYTEDKVFVSGVYRFDHHFKANPQDVSRKEFLKNKNLDPNLKTLFLSTVPPNTYPFQYDVWRKVVEMRRDGRIPNVNLLIRLHPNDDITKYEEFKKLENVHIEPAGHNKPKTKESGHKVEMDKSDLDNLRHSLKYTDVNVNFRSSLSLEATIYDKPVINIALFGYVNRYRVDWYIPIIKSGGVKLAESEEELSGYINDYLKNPNLDSAGRKEIFNQYVKFRDGNSSTRSVEILSKIINS
ncbi:MAG: CDP-glycerol glycerophosphotransferase family protein [Minisyncoccia bacterium]